MKSSTITFLEEKSTNIITFLENNYLDREVWKYIQNEELNSLYPAPLGMNYLNFDSPLNDKKYNFLLGIVNNNISKKTIVCATIYLDEYFIFTNQKTPLTYISSMEVNYYFRNMGIYKKMCDVLIYYINCDQHIITTKQTEMGAKYNVFKILCNTLISNGFQKCIFEDNCRMINSELYDVICSKQNVLKIKS